MNWEDLVPTDIAVHQRRWERAVLAARMKAVGFTWVQVAARLGVSKDRARQLGADGRDDYKRRHPPVLRWLSNEQSDMADLFRAARDVLRQPSPEDRVAALAEKISRLRAGVRTLETSLRMTRANLAAAEDDYAAQKRVWGNLP